MSAAVPTAPIMFVVTLCTAGAWGPCNGGAPVTTAISGLTPSACAVLREAYLKKTQHPPTIVAVCIPERGK